MKAKAAFVVGVGIGYVFGTAAGRQKFEKMKQKANDMWHSESVQSTVDDLQTKATDFAKVQGGVLAEKVGEGVEKVSETVKDKFSSDGHHASDSPSPIPSSPYGDDESSGAAHLR